MNKYICVIVHYDRSVNFKLVEASSYEHACQITKKLYEGEQSSAVNAYPIYPKLVGEIAQMFKQASSDF